MNIDKLVPIEIQPNFSVQVWMPSICTASFISSLHPHSQVLTWSQQMLIDKQ